MNGEKSSIVYFIDLVTIVQSKGVAFVRYKNLANAEFAKEAMTNQSLESNEILNIRWATEDPHPEATAAVKRKAEDDVIQSVLSKLPVIGDKGTILDYENAYKQPKLEDTYHTKNAVQGYHFGPDQASAYHDYTAHYETNTNEPTSASAAYAYQEAPSSGLVAGYESSDDE